MVAVLRRQRRGPILTPSSLPCLGKMPTINLTEGCAHGCVYCYTQGYSGYPGRERINLFDNIPELVDAELLRKRKEIHRVYFSPSSDAFQPVPEVLDVTFRTMSILLAQGVDVTFRTMSILLAQGVQVAMLTKGTVEERFLELFAKFPGKVFAQIGITTTDERLRSALEPNAASVSERLETIERLMRSGVTVRARLDPLIPDLTDTAENLQPLLAELGRRGIRGIAVSYLFVRPAFAQRFSKQLAGIMQVTAAAESWDWHRFADGIGGGNMIGIEDRQKRFARLAGVAAAAGMEMHVCACKNPDLTISSNCRIAGPPLPASYPADLPLFQRRQ